MLIGSVSGEQEPLGPLSSSLPIVMVKLGICCTEQGRRELTFQEAAPPSGVRGVGKSEASCLSLKAARLQTPHPGPVASLCLSYHAFLTPVSSSLPPIVSSAHPLLLSFLALPPAMRKGRPRAVESHIPAWSPVLATWRWANHITPFKPQLSSLAK